jgi:CubicO group peptidase (beta-lactamase class C family)
MISAGAVELGYKLLAYCALHQRILGSVPSGQSSPDGVCSGTPRADMNRRDFLATAVGVPLAAALPGRVHARELLHFDRAARLSAERRGVSMLVMSAGQVLFEDYPNEGAAGRPWETASGTKSFCGVMAAAAVADGLLTLDEPCVRTLPEWSNDARAQITLRQLLNLTSGLAGARIGRPPEYAQAIAATLSDAPGSRFAYSPTPFQVFGEIMRRKLRAAGRGENPVAWLRSRVLAPIGVTVDRWRLGADGMPLLPQGAALTARDWARFGQWVLDGGQSVDAAALSACFEGSTANPGYGLTWWLLRPGLVPPGPGTRAGLEAAPQELADEDVVMAAGAGNQRLYLLRRRRLVVVRQASGILEAMAGRGPVWRDGEFLRALLGTPSG